MENKDKRLPTDQAEALLQVLWERFSENPDRHPDIAWSDVKARLESNPEALWTLAQMEAGGGEPDVIGQDGQTGTYLFCDCAPESPAGRRALCYDLRALEARKANKPAGSAVETAESMGAALLTEAEYRTLQELGAFDQKTSSWIATPDEVRALGGALFCDRRFGRVFTYHNGADSYYAARGFRCLLRV